MRITKTRRKELPEHRRAAILKAAKGVFARQGYSETVVDDIAAHAGIAKGTLYLYFESKEHIFVATLLEDAKALEALTRERMEAASSWQAKLRAYVGVRLEYLESHQDFVRIFLAEFRSMAMRGTPMHADLFHMIRENESRLAQVFAVAVARNEIRAIDPELAALTLCDLTRGLMERRLLGWSRAAGSADADFTLDLLCRGLVSTVSCPVDSATPQTAASPHQPESAP